MLLFSPACISHLMTHYTIDSHCLSPVTDPEGGWRGWGNASPPPYSNFLPWRIPPVTSLLNLFMGHMGVSIITVYYCTVLCLANCYSRKQFCDWKCIKSIWRPSSAPACRRCLHYSPRPLAGFKVPLRGGEGRAGRERGRIISPCHQFLDPPLLESTNKQHSASDAGSSHFLLSEAGNREGRLWRCADTRDSQQQL